MTVRIYFEEHSKCTLAEMRISRYVLLKLCARGNFVIGEQCASFARETYCPKNWHAHENKSRTLLVCTTTMHCDLKPLEFDLEWFQQNTQPPDQNSRSSMVQSDLLPKETTPDERCVLPNTHLFIASRHVSRCCLCTPLHGYKLAMLKILLEWGMTKKVDKLKDLLVGREGTNCSVLTFHTLNEFGRRIYGDFSAENK